MPEYCVGRIRAVVNLERDRVDLIFSPEEGGDELVVEIPKELVGALRANVSDAAGVILAAPGSVSASESCTEVVAQSERTDVILFLDQGSPKQRAFRIPKRAAQRLHSQLGDCLRGKR